MIVLKGKSLRSTKDTIITGEAIVTSQPITLLGFVDLTGKVVEEGHELNNMEIKDKIFIFPKGVGSTVGPYVLINLMKNGNAPKAIINRESDQGTISGCSMAGIPMVYNLDSDPITSIATGEILRISINKGVATVEKLNNSS